jgi:hypothetical protein
VDVEQDKVEIYACKGPLCLFDRPNTHDVDAAAVQVGYDPLPQQLIVLYDQKGQPFKNSAFHEFNEMVEG